MTQRALPDSQQATPFLTATWRHLVMANFAVDAAALLPLVPAGATLDSHGGTTWASVVAFQFLGTRVFGVPVPFHRNFDEINLRFYVRREQGGESRRGVVFVREVVPRRAIALVARLLYNEPYIALPTRSHIDPPGTAGRRIAYGWKQPAGWAALEATVTGEPAEPAEGAIEAFITEHYWGYTRRRGGGTLEYRVTHPRWRVWRAESHVFHCDVAALYGAAFVPFLSRPAASVFVAEGSDVAVWGGTPLRETR